MTRTPFRAGLAGTLALAALTAAGLTHGMVADDRPAPAPATVADYTTDRVFRPVALAQQPTIAFGPVALSPQPTIAFGPVADSSLDRVFGPVALTPNPNGGSGADGIVEISA